MSASSCGASELEDVGAPIVGGYIDQMETSPLALVILATEFAWARSLLRIILERIRRAASNPFRLDFILDLKIVLRLFS